MRSSKPGMKYRDSGVDIDRTNLAKKRIRELVRSTFTPGVVGDFGSFGGLFRLDPLDFQQPILVSSADGVGTKLKIAFMTGIHETVGVDLVAHCTNDILVQGALPLFFLDYIATGRVEPETIEQIVRGLARGCRESECALLGGETAEMPDFYQPGEYDLAGFIVGVVDEFKLYDPLKVKQGDQLIGLASSGLHTNGYSLVRRLFFEKEKRGIEEIIPEFGKSLGEELLTPHRNYLPLMRDLILADDLSGLAHITGGGITENLPRALNPSVDAVVRTGTWEVPPVFRYIRERGPVETAEMYRTFNMGLGLILIVPENRADRVKAYFTDQGEQFYLIGEVVAGEGKVRYS